MDIISAYFTQNIVYVYFVYGLAFFAMGLVVFLESGRASEFRFARALQPLGWFGVIHGGHEWFEMFQIFAAHEAGQSAAVAVELFRTISLAASFLLLLTFGARLLPGAEDWPRACYAQVAGLGLIWLAAVGLVYWRYRPSVADLLVTADVLARYSLGIPGALLAAWALLRERRDFHMRGMSVYGSSLLWAAGAFFLYGVLGQFFTRSSLVFPSYCINTALFLRIFGFPVQILRAAAATVIAFTLAGAMRAFEVEARLRLARANKARLEAQSAALEAQSAALEAERQRTVQVEALVGQLVYAQEAERQRIAHDLHDETGQKLTALAMGLAAVDAALQEGRSQVVTTLMRELRGMADQALIELRNVMTDLRPAQLDDLGLIPALRWYTQTFANRHPDMAVSFSADRQSSRLPPQQEIVLFRVVQEALSNVARHAHARHVNVSLRQTESGFRMEISDDGVGFTPDNLKPGERGGWGIAGMRERVALVGGQMSVEAQPGQGTRISVELPDMWGQTQKERER
jgi:signal transduction histidine kinase